MRLVIAQLGHLPQAVPPHCRQVNRSGQRVQGFVSADVGSSPLPADMLLAGLQRQHIPRAPLRIGSAPHQAAGHLPDVLLLAAEQAQIWAAIGWRDAQRLPLSGYDVGAELARRAQHPHR